MAQSTTTGVELAVIGGSGLYNMAELTEVEEVRPPTPFGLPSDAIAVGTLHGRRVAFLRRHGRGHLLNPSEVPYCANIYALKTLGTRYVISISACGSLRERHAPGHIVIPDQLVDFTKGVRQRKAVPPGAGKGTAGATVGVILDDPDGAERSRQRAHKGPGRDGEGAVDAGRTGTELGFPERRGRRSR